MASIAIKLRDPAGEYWAQLVDPAQAIGALIPVLVERLGLPNRPTYELAPDREHSEPFPDDLTLPEVGVAAGSTIAIRPVRDSLFRAFLKELYDEAVDEAKDQLWDLVREKLEELYRLDPDYPDRQQLWNRVGSARTQAPPSSAGSNAGDAADIADDGAVDDVSSPATAFDAFADDAAPKSPPPPSDPQPATTNWQPKGPPRAGRSAALGAANAISRFITRTILLLVIIVAGGAALIYFEFIDRPDWLPDWFPRQAAANDGSLVNGVRLGTGDVQVTLTWNTGVDLDLEVTDPAGNVIDYGNPVSPSGGVLDVDANALCINDRRVENIYWPSGEAPSGTYRIRVTYYGSGCGDAPTTYQVTVRIDGEILDTFGGTLVEHDEVDQLPSFRR